ncbi:MAG: CBS domain-containing protein [Marinilabiliales bacterium]|nr:CBS domain-containing protein [Marinilabiliales bacterium]
MSPPGASRNTRSITEQLAASGELITHDKDKAVMTLLDWSKEVEKDLLTVSPDDNLGDLVKQISQSNRNIFPVVDEFNILEGVVLLDDVRDKMFNQELYDKVTSKGPDDIATLIY